MARQGQRSEIRQSTLRLYDDLLASGVGASRAQVEVAHRLEVSITTVQRWLRDRRNQQERSALIAEVQALRTAANGTDSASGREANYHHFGSLLGDLYAVAKRKQTRFAAQFTDASEEYLETTLQLAAGATETIDAAVKALVLQGLRNGIPANRLASWSNVAPATVRVWEQEETAAPH